MKRSVLTLAAMVALLPFSGCQKNEKAALETFKAETQDMKTWSDSQNAAVKANPLAGLKLMREMSAKMKAIHTDGLPADLKEAWTSVVNGADKMNAALTEFPAKVEEMPAYFAKKAAENPKFGEEFGKKMKEITDEVKPATEKLKEAAKKYGIEGLEKMGPKQ